MYKSVFLKWWLIFGLIFVGTGFCFGTGGFKSLYENDSSFLSFVILALFYYMTIWCGIKTFKATRKQINTETLRHQSEVGWFTSDVCMGLGMIGTLVGFVIMLKHFHTVNVQNQTSVQEFIKTFGSGMGTALYTTLVGLVASILLKMQYFNLAQCLSLEEKKKTHS